MKRTIIIGIVIALLVGAFGLWFISIQPSLADEGLSDDVVTVERGDIVSTVKATGRLEPQVEVSLGFETNGTVAEVLVERGQQVEVGDPLARIDADELALQVAQAEASLAELQAGARAEDAAAAEAALRNAQASYEKLAVGSRAEDVAAAEAALRNAQANYQALLNGLDDDEITVAAANVRQAEIEMQNAQTEYDKVAYADNIGETRQAAELERATVAYESAVANFRLAVKGASDEQLQAAQAQVDQAQAQLEKLQNGPTPQELAAARAQVDQAQAQLEKLQNGPTPQELAIAQLKVDEARLRLEQATLTAPISGTVVEVNVDVGERAGSGTVILLADLSALHIDLPVDEIDLTTVQVGQPVSIALDALPTEPLAGRVTAIAPGPVVTDGSVTGYEVTVVIEDQNDQAKTGMTANVTIETDRRENVIVIPAHVIQVDKETGQTYVYKLGTDDQIIRTDITLGLRSGQNIEVISGLQSGDQIVSSLPSGQTAQGDGDPNVPVPGSGGGFFSGMREMHDSMPTGQ
jgi:HlyD family secretion protein